MVVDRPSADELEAVSDAEHEKELREHGLRRAEGTALPTDLAETRTRAEYYEALRAAVDGQARSADATADAECVRTAWDGVDQDVRPPLDALCLPPERATHILDGDENGGGGHRHGTGRAGKTEFPADWDDTKIIDSIVDVARSPDQPPAYQKWNGRWLVRGTRDDVEIVVIVAHDGSVWASWPRPGGPGVVKNPEES